MRSSTHRGEAHYYAAQCHLVLKEQLKAARELLMAMGTPGTAKTTSAKARQKFIAVYVASGLAADALSFIASTPVHFTAESIIALLESLASEYARLKRRTDRKVILGLLLKKWPGHAHAASWK